MIAPDQTTVVRESKMKFNLAEPAHHATNVTYLTNLEFTQQGVYFVEVLVDDVMKLRFPVPVIVVQPPPQGATPGQPVGPGAGAPS